MKFILVPVFFLCCHSSFSQEKKQEPLSFQWAVHFSPLALIDFDNTVMLGGEYRLGKNIGVLLDAGYIFWSNYFTTITHASGVHLRPSARLYFGKKMTEYVQLQGIWKHARYEIYDWLERDVVNGVPSYSRLQEFNYKRDVLGLNIIIGEAMPVAKKLSIDAYFGLGLRYRRQGVVNIPGSRYGSSDDQAWGGNRFREELLTASMPAGIRLTYYLR
ncbi:MAG TPA: DUF3575 domain-containing protein [Flavisolibacter sp.]